MSIRLMKHYVTNGAVKARVHYSRAVLTNGRDCVTLYAKDYTGELWKIFGDSDNYENNTDICTDYFEKGRVRIYPDNPLWAAACGPAPICGNLRTRPRTLLLRTRWRRTLRTLVELTPAAAAASDYARSLRTQPPPADFF